MDAPPLNLPPSVLQGADRVLFVGITCGLSAAYVAGQVARSMADERHVTALIGFNPVALARDSPVEVSHTTHTKWSANW